ncbi:MAG: hypothetical protein QOG34_2232 [Frankiaceae bacterium]|jgi:hypothetical protein|nr:hypothetical protein [Frankiaceae bacterium]
MIDFRYHIVSIVAVFLALALGLFLGSTTLQGAVFQDLQKHLTNAQNHVSALETNVDQLNSQRNHDRSFDQALEPYAVAGRLSGQLVVIVSAPGASGDIRSRLMTTLERAGATVTADIRLQSALIDPKQDAFLGGLADRVSIPGRDTPTGTGAERVVAQIADVVGVRPETRPLPSTVITNVLSTYADGNLLTTPAVHGNQPRPGTLAILLTGASPARTADQQVVQSEQTILVDLAKDLDASSLGAVVVGPPTPNGTGQTDLVATVQSGTGSGVSAVRGVDQSAGRIAMVFALVEQLNDKFGSYGTVPGATPLPTPSP